MEINLLSKSGAAEFRVKLSFRAQDSKCGKSIRNYPDSVDPCQKAAQIKRINLKSVNRPSMRRNKGRIGSKVAHPTLEKKEMPLSTFELVNLKSAVDNTVQEPENRLLESTSSEETSTQTLPIRKDNENINDIIS